MQIIIPLTGHGSRFVAAGYNRLKPFILVQNKPIIEWVVKLFEEDKGQITFVCRQEHLDNLEYVYPELKRIAPDAQIIGIKNWEKKGPVNDVLKISDSIKDNQPVLVSYCDYYMHWNYAAFKQQVQQRDCHGAIPCYSGFHPHLIAPSNLYAACRVDAQDNLIEIKEKYSFTADKTQSRHSPGVYYFKTGSLLKQYFQNLMSANEAINGEFYASLPYNYMVKDGLTVWCPVNVKHFCQWGTPKDLQEYNYWMHIVNQFKA